MGIIAGDKQKRVWLVAAGLVLISVIVAWFFWMVRPILSPFILALIVAYLLDPAVNFLASKGIPRTWAILILYLAVTMIVTAVVLGLLPRFLGDLNQLARSVPDYGGRLRSLADGLQDGYRRADLPESLRVTIDGAISRVEEGLKREIGSIIDGVLSFFSGIWSLVLAPFVAFYLLQDLDSFKKRTVGFLPRSCRTEVLIVASRIDRVLSGFVRGQLILAAVVALMAGITSYLFGLRFALLLGIFAGVAEVIPYVGPILGAIPAVLVGLLKSPITGLQVALAFAIIQQIENAVITPKVMSESVGLHPMTVIFAVLAGGYLAGVWGMILAVPVVGVMRVLVSYGVEKLVD